MCHGDAGQVLVYDGSDWISINPDTIESATKKMDNLADTIHKEDERLIEAYNKYRVLRKLILGQ